MNLMNSWTDGLEITASWYKPWHRYKRWLINAGYQDATLLQRHSLHPNILKITQFNPPHQLLKYASCYNMVFIEEYIIMSDLGYFAQFGYNPHYVVYFIYYYIIVNICIV